jgi:hypothetical protein
MKKTGLNEHFTIVRHDFDGNEGIIEPIRSLIVRLDKGFFEILDNTIRNLSNVYEFDEYKEKSQIIGYFAAIKKKNGQVYIGMSVCDPADYFKKDKKIGQIAAISSALEEDTQKFIPISILIDKLYCDQIEFNTDDPDEKAKLNNIWVCTKQLGQMKKVLRVSHTGNSDVAYNFVCETLGEQLVNFTDRCIRYFYPAPKAEEENTCPDVE